MAIPILTPFTAAPHPSAAAPGIAKTIAAETKSQGRRMLLGHRFGEEGSG
jgi:hypothetical protein